MAWEALTSSPEAAPREGHSAVWTGDRLLMWGGYGGESTLVEHATELNIDTGIVKEIAKINKPFFKGHCAFWGNDNMILWGGKQGANYGTSLSYSPITNTWKEFSSENAPEYREGASCVWTGQALIIWGGQRNYNNLQENSFDVLQNTGSYYIPF